MNIFSSQHRTFKLRYVLPVVLCLFVLPLFFYPSFAHPFTQGKELFFRAVMMLTMGGLGITLLHRSKGRWNAIWNSPVLVVFLLLVLVMAVSNLFSPTPLIGLYGTYSRGLGLVTELFLLFFVLYVALGVSKQQILFLLRCSFISAVLVAAYAFLQQLGWDPFFTDFDIGIFVGRAFSFLGNPSYLGQFMALEVLIGLYLTGLEKEKRKRMLMGMGVLILLAALVFSGTRTAVLGLGVAAVLVAVREYRVLLAIFRAHKRMMVVGVIAGGILLSTFPVDRFSFSDTALRSLWSRVEIWKGTVRLIEERPLLGYGSESFYVYFPEVMTKKFLTLEEQIGLTADRIHNETLEVFFSHGIVGLVFYALLLVLILRLYIRTKDPLLALLALLILINAAQNQLGFPDMTIRVLVAFCLGALIALQTANKEQMSFALSAWRRWGAAAVLIVAGVGMSVVSVYHPSMSQIASAESREYRATDAPKALEKHQEALAHTPYYSQLWYELMFLDSSSMERALSALEQIEGDSGNVLAWKGNFYKETNREKSGDYYIRALEKNPYHPNWIRAYADMLYKYQEYELALFMYDKFLEAIPEYWKWTDDLEKRPASEQWTYRTFMIHAPYFEEVIEKMKTIQSLLMAADEPSSYNQN
jgi:O-antigen ligase